ncbi:MAG: SRPBCC domain-containing protein [candidate division Zixibacteria bacterium]|nr:SRPBCC domain-containing protein [candidate division Zixibacteria bacterium]
MVKEPQFDWTQFHLGIYIRAKPEDLFPYMATAQGLCKWFLRSAGFAPGQDRPANRRAAAKLPAFDTLTPRPEEETCRTGDRYRWEWYYDDGVTGEGWIIEVRPPTRLAFGFGDRMEVELSLRKQGIWCEAGLRQHKIPDTPRGHRDMHMGCRVAWTFFLTNLKSVVEGRLDLRETERAKTRQLHLVNI